jgi:hypothetical protein
MYVHISSPRSLSSHTPNTGKNEYIFMDLYIHTCLCMYICMYVFIYMYIYLNIHINMYLYIYCHQDLCLLIHLIQVYTCFISLYVYIYGIYIYLYTYLYVYKSIFILSPRSLSSHTPNTGIYIFYVYKYICMAFIFI